MKLTKEHVGKRVARPIWEKGDWLLIEWLDNGFYAGHDDQGRPFASTIGSDEDWEIVDSKKKPSDRINEIIGDNPFNSSIASAMRSVIAIIEYLDEQAEENDK